MSDNDGGKEPEDMRRYLTLVAFAIAAQVHAQPADAPPTLATIEALVFLEAGQDPAAVQERLTEVLVRAAVEVQQADGSLARPLVETVRTRQAARRADIDVIELKVTLPEGITREAYLQALASDETCTQGTCGDTCRRLARVATGGHWHFIPHGGRPCLVAFLPDQAAALQAEKVVVRNPRRYGVGRTPDVRVTIGRPEFPEEIDKQP